MLSLSSNASQSGSGILWACHPIQGDANQAVVPGELQAFAADDVTHELWNSNMAGKRDGVGNFAKFVPPTVVNGKVYLATFSGYINVYGLNPPKVSTCANNLLAAWRSADIGYVGFAGGVCYDKPTRTFTVTASGDDIWNQADAFHYVYQSFNPTSGDIIARVKSMDATDGWSKCGVMFRKNLDPGSPHVFMAITGGNGRALQSRLLQGGDSYNVNDVLVSAPYWVRLSKQGDKYIGYTSADGVTWNVVDSVNVSLGNYAYAGIAYTTHNNGAQGTAAVDSVRLFNNGVLPIELGRLAGSNVNNEYASLQWTSSNELESDGFEIERSDDNVHYYLIGSENVNTSGAGSHNYTFKDQHPLSGINYYRIKQSSKDGELKYSNVLPLSFNTYTFNIYPNPAHNQLFVRYGDDLGVGKKVSIQLINTLGVIVYQQQITLQGAANTLVLGLPASISSGMYIVQAVNEKGEKRTRTLFVER